LWSEEYERDVKDVFAVQDEISHAIVGALQLRLTGAAGALLVRRSTTSPEAHDLYLKGRYFFGRRSGGEDLRRGVAYFEQTIRTDSFYAEAYSGLSDAYSVLSIWGYLPPDTGFPRAKAAALRALQLDSTLAEAYTSLGIIHLWYDYDRLAAEQELTRAIALDPQYPPAHLFYAWYLVHVGRTTEAVREAQQARELDPLSVIINTRLGTMLFFAHRYPEAIAQLRRTLELDSTNTMAHAELAQAWMAQGRCIEAVSAMRSIPRSFPNYEGFIVGYADARCGRRAEATRLVREVEASASTGDAAYLKIAAIYISLGNRDAAFTWLNRVRPTYFLSFVKTHPLFEPLHGDPRYAPLLGRIGLQP
jgi:tetratricopeptide (TPR) repeat protein